MNCFCSHRWVIAVVLTMLFGHSLVSTAWCQVKEPTETTDGKFLTPVPLPAVATEKMAARASDSSQEAKSVIVVEALILQAGNESLIAPETTIESNMSKLVEELQASVTSQHGMSGSKVGRVFDSYPWVTVLSRPSLALQLGTKGVVSIGQETSLAYMEKVDNETFKLRRTDPQKLGIDLSLTVSERSDAGDGSSLKRRFTLSPVRLELTVIDGRTKVDGVDLPIGLPIVKKRFVETAIHVNEGELALIDLPVAKGKHVYMIVLVRQAD